jgi:hypothetical protein
LVECSAAEATAFDQEAALLEREEAATRALLVR